VEADKKSESTTIFQIVKKYFLRKSLLCVSCGKLAMPPVKQQQKNNMKTKNAKKEQEKQEQTARLREWMPEGSTVYTILRHVSASGMSRDISLIVPRIDENGKVGFIHPNYVAAKVLGDRLVSKNGSDAIRIGGCGMDMGFHLVYSLSYALYGNGYALNHAWL
jgi:hypothetical protein